MQKFRELPEDTIKVILSFTTNKVFKLSQVCKYFNTHIFNLRIREIKYNQFSKMKDEHLLKLVNLASLDLECNNCITDSSLEKLVSLTSLNLRYNDCITNSALEKLVSLTSLNLRYNNRITNSALEKLVNLTSLNLCGNNCITNSALEKLVNLASLDLSYIIELSPT